MEKQELARVLEELANDVGGAAVAALVDEETGEENLVVAGQAAKQVDLEPTLEKVRRAVRRIRSTGQGQ